jgi:hypothetical protein
VVRVIALAQRRGPAIEARRLYDEITEEPSGPCVPTDSSAYRRLYTRAGD